MMDTSAAAVKTRGRFPLAELLPLVVFCSILFCPMLFHLLGGQDVAITEKRNLAPVPKRPRTLDDWFTLPRAVDEYLGDHFGFRPELIVANSYLRYRLGVSSSTKVLVGREGWLFYAGDPKFEFYRGVNRLNVDEVSQWVNRMETRRQWLAARGARLIVLPAPVKESIYPERLPRWLSDSAGSTHVDQVLAATKASGLTVVDTRDDLKVRKKDVPVYSPYDTHWTSEGAFVAYRRLMREVVKLIPGTTALTRDQLKMRRPPPERTQINLALMLGIHAFVHPEDLEYAWRNEATAKVQYLTAAHEWTSPRIITTAAPNGPRLLMVSDSFASLLLPFLEDTFSSILVTHIQDGSFPQSYIESFRPDLVVIEVQEAGISVI